MHFSHGEQRFSLDTAPEAGNSGGFRRNHRGPKQVWMLQHLIVGIDPPFPIQVVMGLQKPLTVERGEQLFGKITLKPDFTQHRFSVLFNSYFLNMTGVAGKVLKTCLRNRSVKKWHKSSVFRRKPAFALKDSENRYIHNRCARLIYTLFCMVVV